MTPIYPFTPPPTRNSKKIIRAFIKTKKYSPEFLADLKHGLKLSGWFSDFITENADILDELAKH
ncbi:hypothetical protein A2368_01410 [Candidatus Collierbacteria bacterium RIFOXYB1_FULL_49_13]|uniref:Uncharacterized protein n=1 Tax=Candidatus Collierbacteria bacterium RIFOXYB1_FULL_49_13 TaxID=1817728 RepID=A0A1F5FG91_9BACT|nr:MAG: hypothetical protein A2368_01410 [Candidatus Collierbacteria bacterium RIFOXYB1_FULL_49_13]